MRWLLLTLAFTFTLVHATDTTVEVLELRSRRAEELIPTLRPLLDEGGSLSGTGSQLIVKSTPANIEQIRGLLSQLDRRPRSLTVSFAQVAAGSSRGGHAGLSGSTRFGDRVGIEARSGGPRGQNALTIRTRTGSARLEGEEFSRSGGERRITRVRAVEGGTALTHLNGSALSVTPRFQGESNVVVDLKQNPGLETSVSAPLGKWVPVGALVQSRDANQSTFTSRGSGGLQSAMSLYLRIDVAK